MNHNTEAYDEIEERIVNQLRSTAADLAREDNTDTRQWTRAFKTILYKLASEFGLHATAGGIKEETDSLTEWLYDMIWYEADCHSDVDIISIPLIMESEFGNLHDVQYDFAKLIQARAYHKLMIFQEKTEKDINPIKQSLKEMIEKSKLSQIGDRYLFAGYNNSESKFDFELFVYC